MNPFYKYFFICSFILGIVSSGFAQFDPEISTRGVVAVADGDQGVYVGWRSLASDPDSVGFNLYRITDGGTAEKLNEDPLTGATNFLDSTATLTTTNQYYVVAVVDEVEQEASAIADTWGQQYLDIPLDRPEGGTTPDNVNYTYSPNDASAADLDGDGEFEIIIKWDPSNSKDNSQEGYTGNVLLDAYEMDGTRLWRVDMGINVRAGAHYTQFMVYDLDGDGTAEMAVRTAPGSKDGTGNYLSTGPAASIDHTTDYRNNSGRIITGPEYITVFSGVDGSEITTIDFEPGRGNMSDWGDGYGNRGDRFLGAIAYLDGENPSLVWGRGIYEKMEIAAFDFDGSDLNLIWHFKTQEGYPELQGMGSHNLSVGDVDADGRDEIVYGNAAIDDDGTGLWSLRPVVGQATGDAMHLADIIPDREGLEKFGITEGDGSPGSHLVDAATGEVLWLTDPGDVGRGVSGDLVPEFYGMECWGGTDGLRSANNIRVGNAPSSYNFVVWWDGDLSRELLDQNSIRKYTISQGEQVIFEAVDCSSNNGTKATPALQADLFGDWREEVIWRTNDNNNLRVFTTTIPTEYRINTLVHDRQYRLAVAWQNNSYNQPPHPSFYLGNDMFTPAEEIPPSTPTGFNLIPDTAYVELAWNENIETDLAGYRIFKSTSMDEGFELLTEELIEATMYQDEAIILDTEYFYYLVAEDISGNQSISSDTLSGIPTLRPDPPVNVSIRTGGSESLIFWEPSPSDGVLGYNVFVTENSGTDYTKLNEEPLTDTEYIHSSLTDGITYYYVVTSVDDSSVESFYSNEVSVTVGGNSALQAEDAIFEGVFVESNHAGFNGTGFANFDGTGFVEFRLVYSAEGGWYNLNVRHALGTGSRTGLLIVNDSSFSYTMEGTADWTDYVTFTVPVLLNAGFENTIRFEATGGDFGNLDEIMVGEPAETPNLDCNGTPGGSAFLDECGVCIGGDLDREPCSQNIDTDSPLGLVADHSGMCLGVADALEQQSCNGSDNQRWEFIDSDGFYKIRNVETEMFLEVSGSAVAFGDTGTDWRIEDIDERTVRIIPSENLDLNLAVPRESTDEGTLLFITSRSNETAGSAFRIGEGVLSLKNSHFGIYPNPVCDGVLSLKFDNGLEHLELQIYNLSGGMVLKESITPEQKELDISTINQGLYLVKVLSKGAVITQEKLLIQ